MVVRVMEVCDVCTGANKLKQHVPTTRTSYAQVSAKRLPGGKKRKKKKRKKSELYYVTVYIAQKKRKEKKKEEDIFCAFSPSQHKAGYKKQNK